MDAPHDEVCVDCDNDTTDHDETVSDDASYEESDDELDDVYEDEQDTDDEYDTVIREEIDMITKENKTTISPRKSMMTVLKGQSDNDTNTSQQ